MQFLCAYVRKRVCAVPTTRERTCYLNDTDVEGDAGSVCSAAEKLCSENGNAVAILSNVHAFQVRKATFKEYTRLYTLQRQNMQRNIHLTSNQHVAQTSRAKAPFATV